MKLLNLPEKDQEPKPKSDEISPKPANSRNGNQSWLSTVGR